MPRLTRRHRARIAVLTVFCLLFQQLALAAYACSMENEPAAAVAMADCHSAHSGTAPDPLCQKHCTPDTSTAAEVRSAGVAPLALPPDSVLPLPVHALAVRDAMRSRGIANLHAPPATLAFTRLLI